MAESTSLSQRPVCPSAQPEWPNSVVFGVVGGTASDPSVSFLPTAQPVTEEVIKLSEPVTPVEVFRFAAPCLCKGCIHFSNEDCQLVKRIVNLLPVVTEELPPCDIRPQCRWWQQEGIAACKHCPQVVTANYNPSEEMIAAALPAVLKSPIEYE